MTQGSSVPAGLCDPYIVILVEPGEQPVSDLGGGHPGDSGGLQGSSVSKVSLSSRPKCRKRFRTLPARDLAPAMADSD